MAKIFLDKTGFDYFVGKLKTLLSKKADTEVAADLADAYGLEKGATIEDVLEQIVSVNVNATEETLPAALSYRSIAYGAGKFVAVAANSNTIVYSEDGVTWATATLPVSKNWYSVAYGDGAFVAVAYSTSAAVRSTDGVTWEEITLPASASWCSITYGAGKFVAISGHASSYNNVAVSSDGGVTWESAELPSYSGWRVVTYGAGKFLAVSGDGDASAISLDGVTWEEITLPVSGSWISAAYGNGWFVVIRSNSDTALRSTDGRSWETITMPGLYSWATIAYGDGKFVAAGNTSKIYFSTDCVTWTAAVTMDSSRNIKSVAYGTGKFVAVASGETVVHCITIANALGLDHFAEKRELEELEKHLPIIPVEKGGTGRGAIPENNFLVGGPDGSYYMNKKTPAEVLELIGAFPATGGTVQTSGAIGIKIQRQKNGDNYTAVIGFGTLDNEYGTLGFDSPNVPRFIDTNDNHYNLLHTGNKPSGSYTGNGSATGQTINTGGLTNNSSLLVVHGAGWTSIVGFDGVVVWQNTGTSPKVIPSVQCTFRSGVLTIATADDALNANAQKYTYQVL